MTPIIKLMLTSLLVATPATATHMDKEYGQAKAVAAVSGDAKTVRWKDQARLYEGEPGQRNSRLAYVGVSEPAPMAPRRVAQNFVPPLIGMAGPFPLRELYEMLTAEQRAQLRPPSAPM